MKYVFDIRLTVLLLLAMALLAGTPRSQSVVVTSKPGVDTGQQGEASEIWTDHLKLRTYPSQPAVAPGRRISLIVEIQPGARMHVYAPGANDYRIIALTVATQPFVRLAPVQYPASEIYVFEPLNERIPVYQNPFKLIQEVMLETRPEAQAAFHGKRSLTVTGTLDYQACDDKICFKPVSVPLSWALALQPNATQRPSGTPTRR